MRALLALTAVAVVTLSGCLSGNPLAATSGDTAAAGAAITSVRDRASLPFETGDAWSHTLEAGPFGVLDALSVFVDVDVPVGQGVPTQQAHMGVFLPSIPGCDWEAAELPAECKVPVIADVGPYYADLDLPATSPETRRLGGFLIQNFVPHGYAVAQVSVLGTGASGGCMDLLGEVEQAGIQASVDWLGKQPWSNGNVGLIGRSYDGSTPWEAAMVPSEHLKTIVPISGLGDGAYDLMWRNGSAEVRGGAGLLWAIYYTFTLTPEQGVGPTDPVFGSSLVPAPEYAPTHVRHLAENAVCPDTQTGLVHAVQTWATGSPLPLGWFQERAFKAKVLENYEGSIYFIHGLQDWNVDPHAGLPFYEEYRAKGLEMKGLFGQWAHNYPDRIAEHEGCDGRENACMPPLSVRMDWAQDLKEWFDHYLKGTGAKPELHVEIQDDKGRWRIEETWPPADAVWKEMALGDDLKLTSASATVRPLSGALFGMFNEAVVFESEPLAEDLRVAGQPQLHATVTPRGAGGQLFFELRDVTDDKVLGHGIMDLRYAAGGVEMRPVVPHAPITALMQFEPLDIFVPAGHVLSLSLTETGEDYMPPSVSTAVEIGDGVFRLPTIERAETAFFMPPAVTAVAGDDPADP